MEKPRSYYDWELQFKKKSTSTKTRAEPESVNSLHLTPNEFKNFLEDWKRKNL